MRLTGLKRKRIKNIYDPGKGDPGNGIKPGTLFENLPDDWSCPECGVNKDRFEEMREE